MSTIWEQIKLTIETVIYLIRDILGLVLALIRGDWDEAWNRIKSIAQTIWDWICATAENVGAVLSAIWQGVSNTLADLWNGIKTTAQNVWKAIANGVIGMVNKIIDGINAMIRGLNSIRFSIPDWVPVLGGKSFGLNLKTISKIPLLAAGGTIVGSGLAVVGEAGPELVSLPRGARVMPLSGGGLVDDIAEAVYHAVWAAMRAAQATTPQVDREIILRLDGRTVARAILPAIVSEGQRQGLQLVVRPQGV